MNKKWSTRYSLKHLKLYLTQSMNWLENCKSIICEIGAHWHSRCWALLARKNEEFLSIFGRDINWQQQLSCFGWSSSQEDELLDLPAEAEGHWLGATAIFPFLFHPITQNYLASITLARLHILVNAVRQNCLPFLHHKKNCNIRAPPLISSVELLEVKPPFVSKVTKRNSTPACFWIYK